MALGEKHPFRRYWVLKNCFYKMEITVFCANMFYRSAALSLVKVLAAIFSKIKK
jgi:hypothetical protein